MAMSRSMLESLLARVRQRAVEPRQQVPPLPVLRVPQIDEEPESSAPISRAVAEAAAPVLEEEFIEEYDDELIEIIDDGDVASESAPESAPLELRASAPSVEMRRHAVPMSAPPVAVPAPRAVPAPVAPALHAEVVARRPIPAAPVVQSQGARRDASSASFIELLDTSLKLGS
jgi:hypothetical protein